MDDAHAQGNESGRIAQLLDEVHDLAPAPAWERVEDLLRLVLSWQRQGLERLLAHARAAGADERLDKKLEADEVVSSLLLLHGLHPVPPQERMRRALADLRPHLSARGAHAELIGVDGGVARLSYSGPANGLADSLRRAMEDAAPELGRIEIDAPAPRAPMDELVPLRVARGAP
jgi:hypothetical protein